MLCKGVNIISFYLFSEFEKSNNDDQFMGRTGNFALDFFFSHIFLLEILPSSFQQNLKVDGKVNKTKMSYRKVFLSFLDAFYGTKLLFNLNL